MCGVHETSCTKTPRYLILQHQVLHCHQIAISGPSLWPECAIAPSFYISSQLLNYLFYFLINIVLSCIDNYRSLPLSIIYRQFSTSRRTGDLITLQSPLSQVLHFPDIDFHGPLMSGPSFSGDPSDLSSRQPGKKYGVIITDNERTNERASERMVSVAD